MGSLDDDAIKRIEAILQKYCNPKKEFDHIPPRTVAQELLTAARGY
jgi:hypothetical protein